MIPLLSRFFLKPSLELKESPIRSAVPEPQTGEIAWSVESFLLGLQGTFSSYNPDQLVHQQGADIYRKMLRDPQVKAAFNMVSSMLTSRSWRFDVNPDEPEAEQQHIQEFFEHNLSHVLSGTFRQLLRTILLSKAHGYSVTEKVYEVVPWQGKDYWMLKAAKMKPFQSFTFEQDEFNNVSALIQEQLGRIQNMDRRKFIIHVSYPELDPVWGESDLRAAYRAYWEKDVIQKLWNIYLERLMGFLVLKPNDMGAALSNTERGELQNILKRATSGSSMILPSGFDLDTVQAPASDAFERAIEQKNKEISKALLMPNLLGLGEQGSTGSYAQSSTQKDVFLESILEQSDRLADTLNEQLFTELAWWNFGTVSFPRFSFERWTEDQKRKVVEAWTLAVEKGVVVNTFEDEAVTRSMLDYPDREKTEADDNPAQAASPDRPEPKDVGPSEGSGRSQDMDMEDAGKPTWQDRVNFIEIGQRLNDDEARFKRELSQSLDQAWEEVQTGLKQTHAAIAGKDSGFEQDIEKLDEIIAPATKRRMNQIIQDNLLQGYDDGRSIARSVLGRAIDQAPLENQPRLKMSMSIAPRKAIAYRAKWAKPPEWTIAHFVEGINLDTAEKYFSAKAFWITGDLTKEMIDQAKLALLNGIRDELSYEEIIALLSDILSPLIGAKDTTTGELDPKSKARLEVIARTNLTDAFVQAQLAVYTDPDLGDFVEAFEYNAVLDSRTTDFCRQYNGKIYAKNDPIWGHITPPSHYNCRAGIVPVTALDQYQTSQPLPINPAKGFGSPVQFLT